MEIDENQQIFHEKNSLEINEICARLEFLGHYAINLLINFFRWQPLLVRRQLLLFQLIFH